MNGIGDNLPLRALPILMVVAVAVTAGVTLVAKLTGERIAENEAQLAAAAP